MIATAKRLLASALGLTLAFSASTAQADYFDTSYLSVTYAQPTGTALPTDTIDVYLTLTLAADSPQALLLDFRDPYNIVAPDNLLPTQGNAYDPGTASWVPSTIVNYDAGGPPNGLSSGVHCAGEFMAAGCGAGAYTGWGQGAMSFLSLAPGESTTWKVMELLPTNGYAAPGVYRLSAAGALVSAMGLDAEGRLVVANIWAVTLPYPEDVGGEYGFTRTVVAVPEPESIALVFAGLAIVGMTRLARRKSR